MKDNNKKVTLAFIGIILIVIFMILLTITYIKLSNSLTEEDIFNKKINVSFIGNSNITLVNSKPSDTLNKSFTIENISDEVIYYDIIIDNIINNFENQSDIVYTLYGSNDGGYIKESIFPSIKTSVAANIELKPHEKQTYSMNITFLKTDSDQSNNLNKTISSNIRIVKSDIDKYYSKGTLLEKVLSSYNIKSESKIDNTSLNGIYTTNNSIDGKRIFYFKGDNTLNNNVIFAGYCFKILRTDENMGLRLVYSGNYENNSCNFDKVLDVSSFNDNNNYNAYVGFMYGSASSNNYIDEHKNINSSKIKTFLDNWYINNLSKYSNIISDSYYCNNRKTSNFKYNSTLYGTSGYANNNTGYASFKGLSIDSAPTLKCYNVSDRFSINLKNGNNALNYPVGLLTADEVSILGNNSYLNTNNDYWTMTPAYYNGAYSYNYIVSKGKLIPKNVSEKYAVRPVITLKSDVKYTSGDGSIKTPYIIK